MRFVYFECTEGTKQRFYRLTIQPGLFGPVLIREWGRIGTTGQLFTHSFASWDDLYARYQELFMTRLRRGYRVVASGGFEEPVALFSRAELDAHSSRRSNIQTPKRLSAEAPKRLTVSLSALH